MEDTESGDFGVGLPINRVEVLMVVRKLHNAASGAVPLNWQTGLAVPLFKKRGPEGVFQIEGNTLQPPW